MPRKRPTLDRELDFAYDAVENARQIRRRVRRRTRPGAPRRNKQLDWGLASLHKAMTPIRHHIAVTQRQPNAEGRGLALRVSALLQAERRKLWKMRQAAKRSDTI